MIFFIKTWEGWPNSYGQSKHVHPCHTSVATDDRKQFRCLTVKNNKRDHYFWNSNDSKTSFSFLLKDSK